MQSIRFLFALFLALSTVVLPSSAISSDNCRLTIAWEDWKPYIYMQEGQLKGVEYLYLLKLTDKVGCRLQFVEQPWIRSLRSLENNSVDVLYGASYTKGRDAFAHYSEPYRYEEFVFVSNDTMAPKKFSLLRWLGKKKTDQSTKVIGLIRGFYYGDELEPIVRNPSGQHQINEVRRDDQLESMLNVNRIDGFIIEKIVAEQMVKKTPGLKISHIEEAQPEPMHLLFSSSVSQDLINLFNRAISDLKKHQ